MDEQFVWVLASPILGIMGVFSSEEIAKSVRREYPADDMDIEKFIVETVYEPGME